MVGEAKRKYDGELIRFAKSLRRPLDLVVETLKPDYSANDLLQAFKDYYPLSGRRSVKDGRYILRKMSF